MLTPVPAGVCLHSASFAQTGNKILYFLSSGQQLEQDVDEEKRIYNKAKWPRLRPPTPVGSSSSAGLAEDTLRAFWKVRSSDLSEKEKLQVHAFVSEVLPQRLQDK